MHAKLSQGEFAVITRRKRSILEMAVATACFGAAAVAAAMPLTATAAPQSASAQNSSTQDAAAQNTKTETAAQKKSESEVANEKLLPIVVVNGFISSLQNSIAVQKNADSIVEAVSAQEIGQLPGTSIADALGRLPGLSVQYVNGRPQQLSIHGMSSDFITTQIDGMVQPSTANNRDVQLDQYPPSWFNVVKVHLAPSANMINPGLAGTVDMETMRPLDQKGMVAHLNANYQWLSPSDLMPGPGVSNDGHDIDGIFADQFFDRTFGVAFGVDLEANPSHILHQAPWGYATDKNGNLIIGGSKNYNISDVLKRNGYLATFEFKPNENFTSLLDLTYEDTNETQQDKGAELPLGYGGGEQEIPGTTVNGFDTTGTFNNVYPVIRNDYTHYQATVYNALWRNEFKFSNDWTGNLDASYSRAEREDNFLEAYSGHGYDGPGNESTVPGTDINFTEFGNGMLYTSPSLGLDTSDVVLTDPQGWGAGANLVQAGFINQPHTEDYIANFKASAAHYFENGPFSSVEFGIDRQSRRKDYVISQWFLVLPGGPNGCLLLSCGATRTAPIPASAIEGTVDALGFMGLGPEIAYNPYQLIADGQLVEYATALSSIAVPPDWVVNEVDTTPYLQLNIQTNLGNDVGLRGNVGVQVAHTSQSSDGQRVAPGSTIGGSTAVVLLPTVGGTDYTRVLPSLNLVASLPSDNDVRLSIARTMSRPRMDQMSASLGVSTNVTNLTNTNPNESYFSGTGGNPALKPTMSTNYNLSLEHYFAPNANGYNCSGDQAKNSALCSSGGAGYVQLSGYYLTLSDYINPNAATLANFAPYESGYLSPAQQAQLGTSEGIMTIPDNDGSGKIYGAQLAVNLPLGDFTRLLNGFGVLASADRTTSAVYYPGNTQPVTVEGLSKWVDQYTLYYEFRGFQAEVSDSVRSSYLGRVFGISATRIEQYVAEQATVDAQVSYAFNDGMLNGLTLIFTGSNLSHQGMQTYENNDPRQVQTWERYPRLYTVGFSYDFK